MHLPWPSRRKLQWRRTFEFDTFFFSGRYHLKQLVTFLLALFSVVRCGGKLSIFANRDYVSNYVKAVRFRKETVPRFAMGILEPPNQSTSGHPSMPARKNKPSRHGTLNEQDTSDAVAIDTGMVLEHVQTANTGHLFGDIGKLPPRSAQILEPRYVVYHTFRDERNGTSWIGLNKVTNSEKGKIGPILLVPGQYKLELKLPKLLNRNIAHDMSGTILGGISSLALSDEKAEEAYKRGVPTSYVDLHLVVQGKKHGILDAHGVMDLGVHSTFVQTFSVQERDGNEVQLTLKMYSHSVIKRLKVEGTLFRRDFPAKPNEQELKQRREATKGKVILREALNSGETNSAQSRLDPDVDLREVVTKFYETVAPERLANVNLVFEHFKGREKEIVSTLEVKYQATFDRRGNFVLHESDDVR